MLRENKIMNKQRKSGKQAGEITTFFTQTLFRAHYKTILEASLPKKNSSKVEICQFFQTKASTIQFSPRSDHTKIAFRENSLRYLDGQSLKCNKNGQERKKEKRNLSLMEK